MEKFSVKQLRKARKWNPGKKSKALYMKDKTRNPIYLIEVLEDK